MEKGDVAGAYLKSDMIGDDMWLQLEKELWPEEWKNLPYDDPVVPLEGSLYGLSRSGYAWGWRARKELVKRGYRWIRDVGEDSLYAKDNPKPGQPPVFVVLYVDDLAIAGPGEQVDLSHKELDAALGFSEKEAEDLRSFLSINRTEVADAPSVPFQSRRGGRQQAQAHRGEHR